MSDPSAPHTVDPFRFTSPGLTKMLAPGIPTEPKHPPIPWTPLGKPLAECKVALLSTAGISMQSDAPFDMEYERQNPTRGDASFRRLRADATSASTCANHLHIDTGYIEQDLNVALPLDRLRELVDEGFVGAMAETHYSIMGFQGSDSSTLVNESAPAIAEIMKSEEVDLALLAPV